MDAREGLRLPAPSGCRPQLRLTGGPTAPSHSPRRSRWRQRLIDAEHGLRLCLRMDGTLFAYLFVTSGILAAGFVLRLAAAQWALVILAISLVISAELFHQMLRALWRGAGHSFPPELRDMVRIGAAAVLLASIGAGIAIVLVFAGRLGLIASTAHCPA